MYSIQKKKMNSWFQIDKQIEKMSKYRTTSCIIKSESIVNGSQKGNRKK